MTPVHLHLVLGHVPAIGALFALPLLAYATWRNDTRLSRVALSMFIVIGVAAIAVFFTGEAAEAAVENLPGVSEQLIERHEEARVGRHDNPWRFRLVRPPSAGSHETA